MLPVISLPFGETVRRSYAYAVVNLKTFLKLAAIWLPLLTVYEILNGFPALCSKDDGTCSGSGLSSLLLSLAFILISVAYIRSLITHRQPKWFSVSFGRPELKYIGYALLIILVILIPSVVLMYAYGVIVSVLRLPQALSLLMLVFPLVVAVYCSRLYLVLPAVAVENKEITLQKAWDITRGNANKIFWGLFLMSLPIVIGLVVLSVVNSFIAPESLALRSFVAFFWVALTLYDAALKGSFYGHIYQYFMYYYERLPQTETAAPTVDAE